MRLSVAVIGIVIALGYADECYDGIRIGIGFCLETLVPSLFFFMVVSAYLVQSGIAELLCRPLERLSHALFRLPARSTAVILLSMVGGYPIGAGCAATLRCEGRLSDSQAVKTAYIAVAAGPGFLLNFIGVTLLHQPRAGYILLASQCIAVIATGIIVGRTVKSEPLPSDGARPRIGNNLLVSAVHNASNAAFRMCAMVIVFSALIEVIKRIVVDQTADELISALVEITGGCNAICGAYPLYVTAFFVGFGGLSVHFQIFATLGDIPLNKRLFFLFRIIEGIIMMAATYIYLMTAPLTASGSYRGQAAPSAARSATLAGSAALVLLSLFFLRAITNNRTIESNGGSLCAESQAGMTNTGISMK